MAQKKNDSLRVELQEVEINDQKEKTGITRLRAIEGTEIYAAKKNEVIVLQDVDANLAINSSRQIFAKVPGINIWENDPAGVQLGIAARGLSPNRTSEFNTRQNGYDMSADALGYPESYYSPPAEALEKIQIVRGAASLQYGTQFGGVVNFIMKKGPKDKKIEANNRNTAGSYGLFTTYNSIGGTHKKINYYAFYQYKTGYGWRPNTHFNVHTGYISATYKANEKLSITANLTMMQYLMQQPGGLTDREFQTDPSQSIRSRNWFSVSWNMAAVIIDYKFNENSIINIRNFGFLGSRKALGNLTEVYKSDILTDNRNLIWDDYLNFGSEGRFLKKYKLFKNMSSLLVGYRIYKGNTVKKQGMGDNSSGPDFQFLHPNNPENFNYKYPGTNVAFFSENIFTLTNKLSITPGFRYEYIDTKASGYYYSTDTTDHTQYTETRNLGRNFPLFGIGIGYVPTGNAEIYANISQNYRGITFTDMKVSNPNARINPNLRDESGYNADIGYRGNFKGIINFDIGLFYLSYKNRIGVIQRVDSTTYTIYQYTTNIADSRNYGLESYIEINMNKLLKLNEKKGAVSIYNSFAYVNATYINTPDKAVLNKQVEFAPRVNNRAGITYKYKGLSTSIQLAYTSQQFSDATNSPFSGNAIIGIVPAYYVADWSVKYEHKWLVLSGGINNFTDNIYFTRRATSYPGPGIIPAQPRVFYLTAGLKF